MAKLQAVECYYTFNSRECIGCIGSNIHPEARCLDTCISDRGVYALGSNTIYTGRLANKMLTTEVIMRSVTFNWQNVRGLQAFGWPAVSTFIVWALASCSSSGDKSANENQGGVAVPTNGTAGQSNGAGGSQAIRAVGGTGGLKVGAGGANVTAGAGGNGGANVTAGAGGKTAIAGNGGKGGTATGGVGGKAGGAGSPEVACNPADKSTGYPTSNWRN
jgi:hypothetical protein